MGILVNIDTGVNELIVACVLKSGGDFDAEYVERLRDGVTKNLKTPHRFVCLSDIDVPCDRIELKYDLPGWWSKMELFRPDIPGNIFYLDLDVVIVGDLGPLVDMGMPRMFGAGDSSVMSLPENCRRAVWEQWIDDPIAIMDKFGRGRADLRKFRNMGLVVDLTNVGDQAFIRSVLKYIPYSSGYLCPYPDVEEYMKCSGPTILNKRKNPVTKTTAAIVFNYRPRPREVGWLEHGVK